MCLTLLILDKGCFICSIKLSGTAPDWALLAVDNTLWYISKWSDNDHAFLAPILLCHASHTFRNIPYSTAHLGYTNAPLNRKNMTWLNLNIPTKARRYCIEIIMEAFKKLSKNQGGNALKSSLSRIPNGRVTVSFLSLLTSTQDCLKLVRLRILNC